MTEFEPGVLDDDLEPIIIEVGVQGPEGAQGPAGATGAGFTGVTGPAGPTGPPGATGAGVTGATGVEGPTGATGVEGPVGATGAGSTGATGSVGPEGATGATGVQGNDGSDGSDGATGVTGATGAQGPTGPQGIAGATGAGTQGFTGATGPQGSAGTIGVDGSTGPTGPQGPVGFTGVAGPTGIQGATGVAGNDGSDGVDGTDGNDGATGATGPQGLVGATGTAGSNGAVGATGVQGATGVAGTDGADGTDGTDGATGSTGPVGVTGFTGPQGPTGVTGATGIQGATGTAGSAGATGSTGPATYVNVAAPTPTPVVEGETWFDEESGLYFIAVEDSGDDLIWIQIPYVVGGSGLDLSNANPAIPGIPNPGSSADASRADHVHLGTMHYDLAIDFDDLESFFGEAISSGANGTDIAMVGDVGYDGYRVLFVDGSHIYGYVYDGSVATFHLESIQPWEVGVLGLNSNQTSPPLRVREAYSWGDGVAYGPTLVTIVHEGVSGEEYAELGVPVNARYRYKWSGSLYFSTGFVPDGAPRDFHGPSTEDPDVGFALAVGDMWVQTSGTVGQQVWNGTNWVALGGDPIPSVLSITSNATPTIDTDTYDAVTITALATAITSMTTNLSGTPSDFQKLLIRIKDDGTPRAITWGASFVSHGGTLPTTTVTSKTTTVGLLYNDALTKWTCIAVTTEA